MTETPPGDKTVMEYQHDEINNAKQTLQTQRRFLDRFLDMRGSKATGTTKAYLQGVHDGLMWGERGIEGITQYTNYDAQYDARTVPHEGLSRHLQTVVSEARCENYGNVAVNAEKVAELARNIKEGRDES